MALANHRMILLLDIGNTHTHLGLADAHKLTRHKNFATADWSDGAASKPIAAFLRGVRLQSVAVCSVVPAVTALARQLLQTKWPQGGAYLRAQ